MKLRKLMRKDAELIFEWINDTRVVRQFKISERNMTMDDVLSFIDNSAADFDEKKAFHFAVTDDSDEYQGTVSLKNIDYLSETAEFAIVISYSSQGKGYANFAIKNILEFGFKELKLNRIYLNVLSDNEHAIRLYEKFGFQFEGEFRYHLLLNGELKSLKWFAILAEEFIGGNSDYAQV